MANFQGCEQQANSELPDFFRFGEPRTIYKSITVNLPDFGTSLTKNTASNSADFPSQAFIKRYFTM